MTSADLREPKRQDGRSPYPDGVSRVFTTSVADVYPHYVNKVERKGRSVAELDEIICWLTGYQANELHAHLAVGTTFEDFFASARIHPNAGLITGSVCGVRVEDVEDPLMKQIRYLDKLVDELAKGRPMERILRSSGASARPGAGGRSSRAVKSTEIR